MNALRRDTSEWKAERYEREIARLEERLRLSEDALTKANARLAQVAEIVVPGYADDYDWDDE